MTNWFKTNRNSIIAILCLLIAGTAIQAYAELHKVELTQSHPLAHAFLIIISSALATGLTASIITNSLSENSILERVTKILQTKQNLTESGITTSTMDFNTGVDWKSHIENTKKITILTIRNHHWAKSNKINIINFLRKSARNKLTFVMTSTEKEEIVKALALRHNTTPENEKLQCENALRKLNELFDNEIKSNRIEIILIDEIPRYATYRFDQHIVITIYTHNQSEHVPTIELECKGTMYKLISSDLDKLISTKNNNPLKETGKKITPNRIRKKDNDTQKIPLTPQNRDTAK